MRHTPAQHWIYSWRADCFPTADSTGEVRMMHKQTSTVADRITFIEPPHTDGDDQIIFDGRKVAVALAFHLAEEKPPTKISPAALESLASRLIAQKAGFRMRRDLWACLTNAERLNILAEASGGHATRS